MKPLHPGELDGLLLWERADALDLADGDPVTSWGDLSKSAAATNDPTYKTGIINGHPVVRFAANDELLEDLGLYGGNLGDATIIVVYQIHATGTGRPYGYGSQNVDGDGSSTIHLNMDTDPSLRFDGAAITAHSLAHPGANVPFIRTTEKNGTTYTEWFDGDQALAPTVQADNGIEDDFYLGSVHGATWFDGDIAEVIAFNRVLSADERDGIHRYLATRYGLEVELQDGAVFGTHDPHLSDFEDGNASEWTELDLGTNYQVVAAPAKGSYALEIENQPNDTDDLTILALEGLARQPREVSYDFQIQAIGSDDVPFVAAFDNGLVNRAFSLAPARQAGTDPAQRPLFNGTLVGPGDALQTGVWCRLEIRNIDWKNKVYDVELYEDGVLWWSSYGEPFLDAAAVDVSRLRIMNQRADTGAQGKIVYDNILIGEAERTADAGAAFLVDGLLELEDFENVPTGSAPTGWEQIDNGVTASFQVQAFGAGKGLRADVGAGGGQSLLLNRLLQERNVGFMQSVVQAVGTDGDENAQPSVAARFVDTDNYVHNRASHCTEEEGLQVRSQEAGVASSSIVNALLSPGTSYYLQLLLTATGLEGRLLATDGTVLASATLDPAFDEAGAFGLAFVGVFDNECWWDDWTVTRGRYVSVTGAPANATLAVKDSGGTTLASSSCDANGDGTVDLLGVVLGDLTTLEVDGQAITPDAGVWPGDEYDVSAVTFNTQPNQPSITAAVASAESVELTADAFSDPDAGDTHAASRWQIDASSGDFSSPVVDSGTDAVNLTSYSSGDVLTFGTAYKARVQYQDDNGSWSDWSAVESFQTLPLLQVVRPAGSLVQVGRPEECEAVARLGIDPILHYRLDDSAGASSVVNEYGTDGVVDVNLAELGAAGKVEGAARLARTDDNDSAINGSGAVSMGSGRYSKSDWPGPRDGYVPPDAYGGLDLNGNPGGATFAAWVKPTELSKLINANGGDSFGSFSTTGTGDGLPVILIPYHGNRSGTITEDDPHEGIGVMVGHNNIVCISHAHNNRWCRAELQVDLNDGLYHHVVVVLAAENPEVPGNVKIYLDGVDGATLAGWNDGGPSDRKRPFFRVGAVGRGDTSFTGPLIAYEGYLDEMMIFDTALTAAQIQTLYEATAWACLEQVARPAGSVAQL